MNQFVIVKLPALLVANAAKLSLSEKVHEREMFLRKLEKKWYLNWLKLVNSTVGKFDLTIDTLKKTRDFALSYKGDEDIVVSNGTYKLLEKNVEYLGGAPLYA